MCSRRDFGLDRKDTANLYNAILTDRPHPERKRFYPGGRDHRERGLTKRFNERQNYLHDTLRPPHPNPSITYGRIRSDVLGRALHRLHFACNFSPVWISRALQEHAVKHVHSVVRTEIACHSTTTDLQKDHFTFLLTSGLYGPCSTGI